MRKHIGGGEYLAAGVFATGPTLFGFRHTGFLVIAASPTLRLTNGAGHDHPTANRMSGDRAWTKQ
jgi:hypothetical protein